MKPSYELSFLHHPIPDLSVPTNEAALHPFVDELVARLAKGAAAAGTVGRFAVVCVVNV